MPIMDKVVDVDKVPTLTLSQTKAAYNEMKEAGLDFSTLTAKDIISVIQ
jgi:hypothetical protein